MPSSLKITILLLSLIISISSCHEKEPILITIKPYEFALKENISKLQNKLRAHNLFLVYENSYEGECLGIKYYYFDSEFDSLNYHIDIYTIDNNIEGINCAISSDILDLKSMYFKIENEIVPDYMSSVNNLINTEFVVEKKDIEDIRGKANYYYFEVTTKKLQLKFEELSSKLK